ncbi:hypothetical protein BASA62_006578 [Batrachochytrium salamandrivorans]|nr:hypothetical protein BASA62_006578 [Batrachochytrium salamandrivorans]
MSVQNHVEKVPAVMLLMKDNCSKQIAEWCVEHKKRTSAVNAISHNVPARDSTHTKLRSQTTPPQSDEGQLDYMHENNCHALLLHGTSFQRMEEQHLLKAFKCQSRALRCRVDRKC